jgi:hypothetical protein
MKESIITLRIAPKRGVKKIEKSITMHFHTGELQNMVFHKDQF